MEASRRLDLRVNMRPDVLLEGEPDAPLMRAIVRRPMVLRPSLPAKRPEHIEACLSHRLGRWFLAGMPT